jgi:hypothetical protein
VQVLADADLRGFFWIWEFRQGNKLLLSYEQTLAAKERSNRIMLAAGALLAVLALSLAAWHVRLHLLATADAA